MFLWTMNIITTVVIIAILGFATYLFFIWLWGVVATIPMLMLLLAYITFLAVAAIGNKVFKRGNPT